MSEDTDREEPKLRRAFGALRDHDGGLAPPFGPMRARAERTASVRALSALAIAAVVLLAVWWGWPSASAPLGPHVSFEGTEPLAFLLEPPSASVVRTTEEGWR